MSLKRNTSDNIRKNAAAFCQHVTDSEEPFPIDYSMLASHLTYFNKDWVVEPIDELRSARAQNTASRGRCLGACLPDRKEIWLQHTVYDALLNNEPWGIGVFLHEIGHMRLGHTGPCYDFGNLSQGLYRRDDARPEREANTFADELWVQTALVVQVRDPIELSEICAAPVAVVMRQIANAKKEGLL